MIAAAACRSGTTAPVASVLYRGTAASRAARARAAALAWAELLLLGFAEVGLPPGFALAAKARLAGTFPTVLVTDVLTCFETGLVAGLRAAGTAAPAADTPATHAASPHSSSADRARPDRRRGRIISNSGPDACNLSARL